MKIDASEVEKTLRDCLFLDSELVDGKVPEGAVIVDGIMNEWGFNPARLENHREQVKTWLAALPPQFRRSSGGGWSFLNACMTDEDEQWGEHPDMDNLFSLGIGLGLVKCSMPRDLWHILPGGMPYYTVEM